MTSEELKAAIEAKMGKRSGSAFCRLTGIDRATLHRWESGSWPVPKWVGVLLGLMPDRE